MSGRYAELTMYVAPAPVDAANQQWLTRIMELLGQAREMPQDLDSLTLFRSPKLVLAQTCGYPLVTQLRDQVQLIGRPHYDWPDSSGGMHCSLIISRAIDKHKALADFKGSRGVVNDPHSNSGMNVFRHLLAPLQESGRFFSSLGISGAHLQSLRWVKAQRADLAAIDSVTYAYLARYAPQEVTGLHVVARTALSPTLPYITARASSHAEVERIRAAMNTALKQLPEVGACLGLNTVLPAHPRDYQIVLDYEKEAVTQGFAALC